MNNVDPKFIELFNEISSEIIADNFELKRVYLKTTIWNRSRKVQAITKFHNKKGGIDASIKFTDKSGKVLAVVPNFTELSMNISSFESNKSALANRLLVLPQEIDVADQYVAAWWDYVGDREAMVVAALHKTCEMALIALNLAVEILKVYKLLERELLFGSYDVRNVLGQKRIIWLMFV